ncbi:MAG: hypothetical protein JXA30_03660 [Deltaproteobacteria bacterium]|nr:hypothetical protein [Deltaproteobacteria bacterium]
MTRLTDRASLIRRLRLIAFGVIFCGFLSIPSTSIAQEPLWLVTQIGSSVKAEREYAQRIVSLLRARDLEVIDPDRAASIFEHRHSKAPVSLPPDELEKLQRAIETLSHHLALENLAEAQQSLKVLKQLTPDVADYLNRKMVQAEELFQACLLTAHLLRKGGQREKAYQQIGDCVRTFPGFEPNKEDYPPHIISIFYRAAAEIDATTPATVQISVTSGEGCRARINGVDWGPTPTKVPGIRASQVRVQVECGESPGRIYTKQIQPGNNSFVFDPRFDQAVRSEGGLLLQYASAEESRKYRCEDTSRIADVVGARHVLQLDLQSQQLYRIDVASRSQLAGERFTADTLANAVDKLLSVEVPEPPREITTNAGQEDAFAAADRSHGDYKTMAWGYTGGGLSIVSLAAGWIYWAIRRGERSDFLRSGESGQFQGYEAATLIFAGLGSAGLSASMVAILPEQKEVPWWSWLAGAGGVGLAAYGIYIWQKEEFSCLQFGEDDSCIRSSYVDTLTGPFLTLQSLPLLAVPAVYLARHLWFNKSDSSAGARFEFRAGLGSIALDGRF